jgi:hypothetical protein
LTNAEEEARFLRFSRELGALSENLKMYTNIARICGVSHGTSIFLFKFQVYPFIQHVFSSEQLRGPIMEKDVVLEEKK